MYLCLNKPIELKGKKKMSTEINGWRIKKEKKMNCHAWYTVKFVYDENKGTTAFACYKRVLAITKFKILSHKIKKKVSLLN